VGIEVRGGNLFSSARPTHLFDQLLDGGRGEVLRRNPPAVAQDGDPVDDPRHLFQPMRDVDDPHARALELVDDGEEMLGLGLRERGGGLVHDEHLGIERERLGDLDHLALRDRERAQGRVRIDVDMKARQDAPCVGAQSRAVDEAAHARFACEVDVLGHGEVRHEVELLMDHRDPGGLGLASGREARGATLVRHATAVGLKLTADHFHQGRFARAILATHSVHLAAAEVEADVLERDDGQEPLGDAVETKDLGRHLPPLERLRGGCRARLWSGSSALGLRRSSQSRANSESTRLR